MSCLKKNGLSLFKTLLLLIFVKSNVTLAQNPYLKPTNGIGQYGYLEKDASTTMLLNSNAQGNIYQLFGRTFLNGTTIFTYGTAVNVCGFTTNVDQATSNYNFGTNAIPGLIAYTSVHADYCDVTNSYGSNPNQAGYSERQHYIFDISDRPSDLASNVIQLNPGNIPSTNNVVMSVKIDFGATSSRILQRFWIQNTGTLAEASEIANDGFKLYYEPATGSETFDGNENSAVIYGDYNGNATNNNLYGHDGLNIAIPSGGLRVYVVLNKFASCLSTAKTVQVSLINDGLSFSPAMDTSYTLARVGQTPASPATVNVSLANTATGPLGGTYYIPSACFPTIASAVNALNTNGVNAAVTFNVLAGYSETAPSGGFSLLGSGAAGNLATGTAANTISLKKFGTGANPLITASAAHTASSTVDGIFKIVGGDYITLDGFSMTENAANTVTTAMTEFGVALFYATTTNGAQNNTIKNCSITLNKTNTNTFGIYSNTMHSSTSGTVSAAITNSTGANSNNKFYANTISNTNIGIVVNGSPGFENTGTDIGGASLATGNTITDQGVSAPATGYLGLPGTASYGIYVGNSNSSNISYNSITGNAAANNSYGIHLRSSGTSPTTTHTSSISYNTLQVSCSSGSASYNVVGILNDMGGTNHTLNITNNTIQNSTTTSTSFGGGFGGIWSKAALKTILVSNNSFTNNVIKGATLDVTAANRSSFIKITNIPTTAITVSGNTITANSFTNAGGGDVVAFDINGNFTSTCSIANNIVDGLTTVGTGSTYSVVFGAFSGATAFTGNTLKNISNTGSGSFYGTYISASHSYTLDITNNIYQDITLAGPGSITGYADTQTSSGTLTVNGNTFKNISNNAGGPLSWIRFVHSNTTGQNLNVYANVIDNLSLSSAANSLGITAIYCGLSSTMYIYGNSIKNITSNGANCGIQASGGNGSPYSVHDNTIDGMASSAAGAAINHYGLYVSPTTNGSDVYNNKVYNISSGTSANATITGIYAGFSNTCNLYNNMVGDLKMPNVSNSTVCVLRGIHVTNTLNTYVYNNTVYLNAASAGTDFSSAALCYSLYGMDLRNNILVNNSTPKGAGYSAAIMRVTAGINGNVSYAATSNNNCLYAPSVPNGVIFVEGQYTGGGPTNVYPASCTDLKLFKTFVSARETNSFSEIPPFVSTTAGAMDLHLNTAVASGCFDGGTSIFPILSDIDGNARPMGSANDIGADEANGTKMDKTPPVITYTPLGDVGCPTQSTTLTATITDANAIGSGASAPRLYFKKLSDPTNTIATVNNNSVSGWKYVVATGSYSFNINYALLSGVMAEGDVIQYFVAAQDVSGNVATTSATVTPCVTSVAFTSGQTVSAPPTINQFTYRVNLSGFYTIGTGAGQNFPTLSGTGGLFDAINRGYVTGNITATVTSNTVETGVISLNEWTEYNSGNCALSGATVYRLTVQSDGMARTLEGTNLVYNATSLKAMINLNGADRVTFTGGTANQRNLIFRTTNTTAASSVPVFQMGNGNGSNDIIINNCDIQTNGTSAAAPVSAGIYITNTGTNANNLFQLNDIHDAVSGTTGNPIYGIFAENNTATVLQIKDNNIYNISSKAVALGVSGSIGNGQTITGNSIFHTGVGTTTNAFTGIEVIGMLTSGHTITGNYIGGASALGGVAGTLWTNTVIATFTGINVTSNLTTQSLISGNVVRNLNLSNATTVLFTGIGFVGNVLCENNVIGDATNSALGITINATSAAGTGTNNGIKVFSAGPAMNAIIRNNTIRYITHNATSTGLSKLLGISVGTYPAGSTVTINGNLVSDLSSGTRGLGNTYGAFSILSISMVTGILVGGSSLSANTLNIYENTINNLNITSTGTTAAPAVMGIAVDGNSICSILRNKVYNLTNSFAGNVTNPANITGIRTNDATTTIANNMVYLNNGSNTNRCRVMGIYDTGNFTTIHFNTVVIEGTDIGPTPTSGICSAPYVDWAPSSSTTHDLKNNIFINNRTGGNSAAVGHYAIAVPLPFAGIFTCNYNDLVNTVSTTYCRIGSTSYDLAAWRNLSNPAAPDVNSQNVMPTFIDAANGDLHLADSNCALDNKGTTVAITSDYDVPLITRASPPDIGADEFTSDFRLNITNPPGLRCSTGSVDLTASGITTGGAGSTPGSTLTYWTDATATSVLANPAAVTVEGTYYIKSVKGGCTDIKPIIIVKQGTTWTGGAWVGSGGYPNGTPPDIETAVSIDDNYDTAVNGSFECCSLTVNSPSTIGTPCSVTINPGPTDDGYITVQKDLTVNTNGTLLVENKGSLIMIDDTGVVINNGTTNVKRTTTPFERYDYVYWSAPLNDTRTLSNIFSGWRSDYSFTFNTQNFADLTGDSFDDNSDAWQFAGPGATMTKAKGYAIMTPTGGPFSPSAAPVTVTFTGAANNGIIPIKEYESANVGSTTDDYNLIGNPYPSAIWANKFITDNGLKTSGTLYFWTHVADVSVSNPGPNVANFITADYALYNLSGGTASGTGSSVPSGYIASGQGFFIEAQNTNVDVEFNNSMRTRNTGYSNDNFYRTLNPDAQIDRIWLNLQNPDGLFSQLLIGYFAETTLGFDWAYDGRVNPSNTQVSFYSLAETEKYKIQARPVFFDTDSVPLGYFSIANGEFTISIGQEEGVFTTDQNVYLEDRDMHIIHNLKQSPYTFTTTYGRFEDRFVLRYTDAALGNPDLGALQNSVSVAVNHGQMTIKSYIETIQDVTVYDILGRQLFEARSIGNNDFSASNISMSQQTLIVKIKLGNGTIVTRKIIL